MEIPIKLDEKGKELLNRVTSITCNGYYENDETTVSDLFNAIIDLVNEVDDRDEQIEEIQQDLEDNYKPISLKEQYGE